MLAKLKNYLLDARDRQRMTLALSKGIAGRTSREVDPRVPQSWEFSGFSQNGEDGILQELRGRLLDQNRYFVEIGSGDGIENNSCWMAITEKYNGLMIDGDAALVERTRRLVTSYNIGLQTKQLFVTRETAQRVKEWSRFADPDVFSLDIDGNDYYIAKAILDCGMRPKIFVVEYNSVYGPDRSTTITYQEDFSFKRAHPTQLYYGVSISGWRTFFEARGYRFVTVDRHGVNGFFVDPAQFDPLFLDELRGSPFAENRYQFNKFGATHEEQFRLIEGCSFSEIRAHDC